MWAGGQGLMTIGKQVSLVLPLIKWFVLAYKHYRKIYRLLETLKITFDH